MDLLNFPPAQGEAAAELMAQIDAMTYEAMLRKVRCAPLDDPLFRGEVGIHFHATLKTKRAATDPKQRAAISKKIGF